MSQWHCYFPKLHQPKMSTGGGTTGMMSQKPSTPGTSLVVQWVRLHTPNAGGLGSIPGQGIRYSMHATTNSPHAATKRSHVPQ